MSNLFKSKTVPTTSTTTNEINKFADSNIDMANQRAKSYLAAGGTPAYTGGFLGAQSGQSQQALQGIMNTAQSGNASALANSGINFANGMIGSNGMSADQNAALSSLKDTALGKYLDPENGNPYLQAQLDKMAGDIQNRVSSLAAGSGRYGSGAHQGVLSREIGGAVGNVLSQNYENERNRMMSAAGAWNSALEGGLNRAAGLALNGGQITDQLYSPYERMAGVGEYYDQRNQGQVDSEVQKYLMNKSLQQDDISWLAGIAAGAPSYGTTTTGTTTQPSALQSALGAGSTLAGLIGKLSDRRAKTDIRRIGTAWNGLPLYLYRYKGSDTFEIGVMAQEVERLQPGAVTEGADGLKRVRYDLAFAE